MPIIQDVSQVLGGCSGFYLQQTCRLLNIGIDIDGLAISHQAFRTETLAEYLDIRRQLEPLCSANVEDIWSGRPISKLLLEKPLQLSPSATTELIELIPPEHQDIYQSVYRMGLEHMGIVISETFADFAKTYAHFFTGQQDQGPFCQPYFITFPDNTNVKFFQCSLHDACVLEGKRFDGFYHVIEQVYGISLAELVAWTRETLAAGDLSLDDESLLRDLVARAGEHRPAAAVEPCSAGMMGGRGSR